jgi:hypothetical protein
LKKLLPVQTVWYKSAQPKTVILQRLRDNIEKEKSISFFQGTTGYVRPYTGYLSGNSFNIKRVISYRNAFLPQVKGVIKEDIGGTTIIVSIKPHRTVLMFMGIWMGIAIFISMVATYAIFFHQFHPLLLTPYAMLLMGISIFYTGFMPECNNTKNNLKDILRAEIIEQR